ncbi:EamA family transporter [Paenalcaligenes hominis]|uniref:EamA family transporter n=1 Tax=Paenalcaligenes hominis TaxID=643674 RepID=UPI003523A35A
MCLGSGFAANHVSARVAFDAGTGLLAAILFRAGLSFITLLWYLIWTKHSLHLPKKLAKWQLTLGVLICLQSLCIFSAVARIPVAIALLVANTFPILLAFLTWALGGPKPSRHSLIIMGVIFFGLIWVLDLPTWWIQSTTLDKNWYAGLSFALGAACCFSFALWITEHKLGLVSGPVRSLYTIAIVLFIIVILALSGTVENSTQLPHNQKGWVALILLGVLYTLSFIGLFVFAPKLNMATNSPAMNIEPVTSLFLAWIVLDQTFSLNQLFGGAIVLFGIISLAYLNSTVKNKSIKRIDS